MKTLVAVIALLASVGYSNVRPEPWQRETWRGILAVESNPWGGFGCKTFELFVETERGFISVSENLAFASVADYRNAERFVECKVELTGIRVRRGDTTWILVEGIRERRR